MARLGMFGGFVFDPEVFSDYMSELPTWNNAIIASGILREDATIMGLIGANGNVATLPFYKPINVNDHLPYNNDGLTDNVPQEIEGSKQTCMLIQRMMAWKAQDFTVELTLANPLQHVANSNNNYYQQVWERELMNTTNAVVRLPEMEDHITHIASLSGTITDANMIDEKTMIRAQQKALGDMTNRFGLAFMHSYIFASYQALGLVNYNKYTITNAVEREIELPTINGIIPIVTDRYTVDKTGPVPEYKTTLVGQGAFLTTRKTNYENPYYTDYDPETRAGIEKLYTKEGRVLHPNGFSLAVDNIAKESPTFEELGDTSNWALRFDPKNIRIGQIISNG